MDLNPNIFREYDIRGRVPDELNQDTVKKLSRAFGTYLGRNGAARVAVGRDCRLSSPGFSEILVEGLAQSGLFVVDLGMIPTPLLYFSLFSLGVDGGIQLTASHNPPDYNGFKICLGKSTIYGEEIRKIMEIAMEGDFLQGKGDREKADMISPYVAFLKERISPARGPLKVVVDGGNGVGGLVAPRVYRNLGVEVQTLFCEPDGLFPNHHPDPTVLENLQTLIERVRTTSADLGISFDGDADRIGVVDGEGRIIYGDQLMVIFSRDLLDRVPGAKIIAEVKCSQALFDDIRQHGGQPIMWKVGHSLIKSKMREEGALLAGEMSGHIFFAEDYFGYDDAVYAGARLIEILTRKGMNIGELLDGVPRMINTPEIRMECPDDKKFDVVRSLAEDFKKHYQVIDIDGARVLFEKGGWGLVRASNTQPVLVLRFEARDERTLNAIKKVFLEKLKEKI